MKAFVYQYPGDPIDVCVVMDRETFLQVFPRTPMEFKTPEGIEVIDIASDHISCDLCTADPGDEIYVHQNFHRAHCRQCAENGLLPYKMAEVDVVLAQYGNLNVFKQV